MNKSVKETVIEDFKKENINKRNFKISIYGLIIFILIVQLCSNLVNPSYNINDYEELYKIIISVILILIVIFTILIYKTINNCKNKINNLNTSEEVTNVENIVNETNSNIIYEDNNIVISDRYLYNKNSYKDNIILEEIKEITNRVGYIRRGERIITDCTLKLEGKNKIEIDYKPKEIHQMDKATTFLKEKCPNAEITNKEVDKTPSD